MASPRSRHRRLLLPTLLAAVLAAEITGLAIARSIAITAASPDVGGAATAGSDPRLDGPLAPRPAGLGDPADSARDVVNALVVAHRTAPSAANLNRPAPALAASARSTTAARSAPAAGSTSRPTSYRGTNHVWMPSLGINRSVQFFPCSRSSAPGPGVYRWGCAGRNNVYLMAHAWSSFKPLHDAYVGGRLRRGMKVWYADGGGRVHAYSVVWWRVVAPTTAASWAWAAQSHPSMTLQTCVGANSQYRLMVRLVQVG
jgi:hypothetical protein